VNLILGLHCVCLIYIVLEYLIDVHKLLDMEMTFFTVDGTDLGWQWQGSRKEIWWPTKVDMADFGQTRRWSFMFVEPVRFV
jgi:hypothetical protein